MRRISLRTPSRLHFGLLSWGDQAPRQFGGVGLMVDAPGLAIVAEPSDAWQAVGSLAGRVLALAERVAGQLEARGLDVPPLRFTVDQAPPEHVGLGVGTQLGMAVARIVTEASGRAESSAAELARLSGRGLRSGIGLHGFALGGLIVDGGRANGTEARPAPLLARLDFPEDWSVLVVIPPGATGLHGSPEVQAFHHLSPTPEATVDRLCRLVLLDLLPSVVERDLQAFGAALAEIQTQVGQGFAPAQGGIFAGPDLEALVGHLQTEGLVGVGQSSWGPTLYGFFEGPTDQKSAILARIIDSTGWPQGSAFWTAASPTGVRIEQSNWATDEHGRDTDKQS